MSRLPSNSLSYKLNDEARLDYYTRRNDAHHKVSRAIYKGLLPRLSIEVVLCIDCGERAFIYEHRDYDKPLEVDPVCHRCNSKRGHAKLN